MILISKQRVFLLVMMRIQWVIDILVFLCCVLWCQKPNRKPLKGVDMYDNALIKKTLKLKVITNMKFRLKINQKFNLILSVVTLHILNTSCRQPSLESI